MLIYAAQELHGAGVKHNKLAETCVEESVKKRRLEVLNDAKSEEISRAARKWLLCLT